MAHKRTDFSNAQKSVIYARDRATCCFSGVNLWLLDSPLRPGKQTDWVDHVRPSARGGKSVLSNGVCASHTYNAKKRHNSSDNFFLFRNGVPTEGYFELFGVPPIEVRNRLDALQHLEPVDWFFNRCISHTFNAFLDRCHRNYYETEYKRDYSYWSKAAYRKLLDFQRLDSKKSLESRGIVNSPNPIQESWLSLRDADSETSFQSGIASLFPAFERNYRIWARYFWDPESNEEREEVFEEIREDSSIDSEIRSCIEANRMLTAGGGQIYSEKSEQDVSPKSDRTGG